MMAVLTSAHSVPAISVNHVTVMYQEEPVLWDISLTIQQGIFLGIIGPNGAGKTTFLKTILHLVKPMAGSIFLFEKSYHAMQHLIAYVPQRTTVDWDFPITVLDVVLMGRYRHIGWFKRPGKEDIQKAHQALEKVHMLDYINRPIGKLSGGQQQRVFLARALAQDATLYILDEPFSGVDMATEKIIITLLKELRDQGKTIVVVHHDLQTLAEYFDWLLLLNKKCVAYGPVHEVLVPEYMCAAYGNRTLFTYNV
ncbi:MAG: metal ABC transporter ATP-binding protein [Candidatus Babeliales bacterium]